MRPRPYVLTALLFACVAFLLPAPTPAQEPVDEAPIEEIVGPPVPEPSAQEPVSEEAGSEAAEPEQAEEAEPEPPTLADVHAALVAAITAEAAGQVSVDAATEALDGARRALDDAEAAHAGAMLSQGEHTTGVREAAQAFVDFLTATYLD